MPFPHVPPAGTTALGTTDLSPYRPLPRPPVIRADRLQYREQLFTSMVRDRDPVDAAVIEAIWRVRHSGAAVQETGARFLDIEKIDDRAATVIASEARIALRRIISRGDITVRSINVQTGPDWTELTVSYINNRAPFKKDRQVSKRLPEEIS